MPLKVVRNKPNIPASTYGKPPRQETNSQTVVLVRNDSGATVERFHVLGIDAPILETEQAVKDSICLSCVEPTTSHAGKFVVLLETLANGSIGRAVIAGCCLARIQDGGEGLYADVLAGDTVLTPTYSGSAQILWIDPDPGEDDPIAFIRFGAMASGGGGTALDPFSCSRFECVEAGSIPSDDYNIPCESVPANYTVDFGDLTCCGSSAAGGVHVLAFDGGYRWLGDEFDCGGTDRQWILEFTADDQPKLYLNVADETGDKGWLWAYNCIAGTWVSYYAVNTEGYDTGEFLPADYFGGGSPNVCESDCPGEPSSPPSATPSIGCPEGILYYITPLGDGSGVVKYNLPFGRTWCCECCNRMEIQGCGPNYACDNIPEFVCVCPVSGELSSVCPGYYPDGLAASIVLETTELINDPPEGGVCGDGDTAGYSAGEDELCHKSSQVLLTLDMRLGPTEFEYCYAAWNTHPSVFDPPETGEIVAYITTGDSTDAVGPATLTINHGYGTDVSTYECASFSVLDGGVFEWDSSTGGIIPNNTTINAYRAS